MAEVVSYVVCGACRGAAVRRGKTFKRRAGWAILACSIASCTSDVNIKPGFVAERWSRTLDEFNIDPIYPPRGINIGEVWLIFEPRPGYEIAKEQKYKQRYVKLGLVDLRRELRRDAARSLNLPATNSTTNTADIFRSPSAVTYLRPTAFPGFSVVNITQGELAAVLPLNPLKGLFGGAFSSESAVSISVPSAESIELPAPDALDAISRFCTAKNTRDLCLRNSERIRFFQTNLDYDTEIYEPRVLIVSSIYYVRTIDYSFSTGSSSAFSGGVTAGVAAAAQQEKPAASAAQSASMVTVNVNSGTAVATTAGAEANPGQVKAPDPVSLAEADLKGTRDRLSAATKALSGVDAGGTFTLASVDESRTYLRQTFPYPVAIGYRALYINPR